MSINKLKINILVVGCISAGKSTFMNGILSNSYSYCKIKRTTMIPQIYNENETVKLSSKEKKDIRDRNDKENKRYIMETENSTVNFDCKDVEYEINKIVGIHELVSGVTYSFCDMPGINDARTKDQYVKYIKENFHKFDIIIFLVDITQPIGTTDIKNTLDLCMEQISLHKKEGYSKYMITIANKLDDMLDFDENLKPQIDDDEIEEIFEDLDKLIIETSKKYDVDELCKYIVPMSCEEMYVYRTMTHNENPDLEPKYLDKIGIDEYGKTKWKTMRKNASEIDKLKPKLLKDINDNPETYAKRMRSSGFEKFNLVLSHILTYSNQYNILYNKIKRISCSTMYQNFVHLTPQNYESFNLELFKELSAVEMSLNKCFKQSVSKAITHKWILHNNMIENLQKFKLELDEICKINLNIEQIDNINKFVDVIDKYYSDIKSSEQKKYVEQINNLCVQCRNIIIANKRSIIKINFGKNEMVFDSLKNLVDYGDNIENNIEELKYLLETKHSSRQINDDLIDGCKYLYSISTIPAEYIDIAFELMKTYFDKFSRRCNYVEMSYECILKILYLIETLNVHNIEHKLLIKHLLDAVYIRQTLIKQTVSKKNLSYITKYNEPPSQECILMEKIVRFYCDVCNNSFEKNDEYTSDDSDDVHVESIVNKNNSSKFSSIKIKSKDS